MVFTFSEEGVVLKVTPLTQRPFDVQAVRTFAGVAEQGDGAMSDLLAQSPSAPALTEAVCAALLSEVSRAKLSPHITPVHATVLMNASSLCSSDAAAGRAEETAGSHPAVVVPALGLVMEMNDGGTLTGIIERACRAGRYDVVHASCVQVLACLGLLQFACDFVHNDLSAHSVMSRTVSFDRSLRFVHPAAGGAVHTIPLFGHLLRLVDFGWARFTVNGRSFCSARSLAMDVASGRSPHAAWVDTMHFAMHACMLLVQNSPSQPRRLATILQELSAAPEGTSVNVARMGDILQPHAASVDQSLWLARTAVLLSRCLTVRDRATGRRVSAIAEATKGARHEELLFGSKASRAAGFAAASRLSNPRLYVGEGTRGLLHDPMDDCVLGPYADPCSSKARDAPAYPILWNTHDVFESVAVDLDTDIYVATMDLKWDMIRRMQEDEEGNAE